MKLLFILACIPLRIIIATLPLVLPARILPFLGLLLFLPIAIGFLYLYFTNSRLEAPEGGGITWWARYRIIHGLLYLTAAIALLLRFHPAAAALPLFADVLLGLVLAGLRPY
jgi:hypothetical protein